MQGTKELERPVATGTGRAADKDPAAKAALWLLGIAATTLAAYSPVMFNFFCGDDFVHLTWLTQAVNHPELVLRNFYTSWLDGTTTRFYRPLISVFMYTDYLAWGVNGLGFRITNLVFHLSSTLFLFLVVRNLQRSALGSNSLVSPLAAAGMFALYPLHPEAVSWITGRVDSVVTTFCLASLWSYLRYRDGSRWALPVSLVSMALGLLSKEMAITIPAVIIGLEVCLPEKTAQATCGNPLKNFMDRAFIAIRRSLPFWFLLGAYFVVRRIALGTFVGGYDNSLFFIANLKDFLLGWLHALKMFVVPINKELLGSHSLITKVWECSAAIVAMMGVAVFAASSKARPMFAFGLLWLGLSLLPVYKLFAIADDLQGSRLAYLATVPLCFLFSLVFLRFEKIESPLRDKGRIVWASFFCVLAAAVLYLNNFPWRMCGQENNAIRAGLEKLYKNIPGDPQIMFVGLPDEINGAYTCRNSLDGMTRRPQLFTDVKNCLQVNPYEPIFPFGYLKESLSSVRDSVRVFRWAGAATGFKQVVIPERQVNEKTFFSGDALKISPVEKISGGSGLSKRPRFIELTFPAQDTWNTEFVVVNVKHDGQPLAAELNLLYTTEFEPEFSLVRRVRGNLAGGSVRESVLFCLRGLPDWSAGGKSSTLRLMVPGNSSLSVESLSFAGASSIIPEISFANSGYLGTKGYMHLSRKDNIQLLSVDVGAIPGAVRYRVETTRTNLLFEEQNTTRFSSVAGKTIDGESGKLRDNVVLRYEDLAGAGIYELRVWALDGEGRPCGLCSDHIVISVDD